jgi:hypothetical protein
MVEFMESELFCLLAVTVAMIQAQENVEVGRSQAVEDLLRSYRQLYRSDDFEHELWSAAAQISDMHPGRTAFWLVGLVGVMREYEVDGRRKAKKFVGKLRVASEDMKPTLRPERCMDLILAYCKGLKEGLYR